MLFRALCIDFKNCQNLSEHSLSLCNERAIMLPPLGMFQVAKNMECSGLSNSAQICIIAYPMKNASQYLTSNLRLRLFLYKLKSAFLSNMPFLGFQLLNCSNQKKRSPSYISFNSKQFYFMTYLPNMTLSILWYV